MSLTIIGKRSILAVWQGTDTPFYGIAIPNLPKLLITRYWLRCIDLSTKWSFPKCHIDRWHCHQRITNTSFQWCGINFLIQCDDVISNKTTDAILKMNWKLKVEMPFFAWFGLYIFRISTNYTSTYNKQPIVGVL